MRHILSIIAVVAALALGWSALPVRADAQIAVPGARLPDAGQVVGPIVEPALRDVDRSARDTVRQVERLARERLTRLDRLLRGNSDEIARDASGELARQGELLVMDADEVGLARAAEAGFRVIGTETVENLGLSVTRLALPRERDLAESERMLGELLPGATVSADNLYFQSGAAAMQEADARPLGAPAKAAKQSRSVPVGIIDGAPHASLADRIRSFATGGGTASNHGSAVASLLRDHGVPSVVVADVYGTDRAGGNALAIARALGWLAGEDVRVITISLVGPANPVLRRAVDAARERGSVIVAAVGNDGPAAPQAYPASYPGVVAVTAVDRSERVLIEAGRAGHVDYAAPGADIRALDRRLRRQRVRGTSYATPLVAARIAAALGSGANWRQRLDSEARDLGQRGADDVFGRGLVCRDCGRD